VAEGAIQRLLVVGYAKRHEGRPDEHIVYNLRVVRPGVEEQELFKRFSEFAELHERAVVATNQHNATMTAMPATASAEERRFLPLPRMPAKLLVGADDRSVLQERVVGLQSFMEQLLSAQPPIFLPLLEEFVRSDDVKSKGNFLGTLRRQKSTTTNNSRSSMRTVRGLDPRDVDNLAVFLKTREESEPSFIGQLMMQSKKSKKPSQQKLLVVTVNRIYVMRGGCEKSEFEGHLRDVKSITSLAESTIEIDFGNGVMVAGELDPLDCTAAICEIRIAEDILFPGRERTQKIVLTIEPKTRLRQLRPTVCGPCGGFVVAFRSMLNYLSTPYGIVEQEIAYLVDNVLDFSNQFYFDFQQFNLQNADGESVGGSTTVQAIMLALVHNLYFRGLIVENYRFDKEAFNALAQVMASNGCFDTLLLDGVNQLPSGKAAGDGISVILQALSKNPRLRGLSSIDLSNNISFGRAGASHLSEFLAVAQQLRYLNLCNNGLAAGEVSLLCDRIAGNALSFGEHLVLLDLSLNTIAANDRSLPAALRVLRSLRHLNLSGALEYKNGETCMPELLASLPLGIELLDLSKNVIRRPDAQPFETAMRRCTQLQELNMSECPKLDPAVVCAVVMSFGGNVILRNNGIGPPLCDALAQCGPQWMVRSLDLSDNPLFVAGFVRICEGAARSMPLQQLRVSSVFQNAKEDKGPAISMLLRLLARKVTPLISLHMAGTNHPLGTSMLPLLAALGQNKTLADLDLRDHLIGNRGATLLAQALQTNASLVSLAYDGNQTAPSGFSALDYALKRNASLRRWPTPSKDVSFSLRIEILKIKRSEVRIKRRDVLLDAVQSIQETLLRNALEAERSLFTDARADDGAAAADGEAGSGASVAAKVPVVAQFGSELDDLLNEPTEFSPDDTILVKKPRPGPSAATAAAVAAAGDKLVADASLRRAADEKRTVAQGQASLKQQTSAAVQLARIRRPSVTIGIVQAAATPAKQRMFGRPLQQAMRVQEDNQMALPTFLAEILACIEKLHLRVPALLTTLRNADRNRVEAMKRDIDNGAPSEWLTVPVSVLLSLVALWLQSLPEPAFTYALLNDWVAILSVENGNDVNAQSEAATRVVRRMPPANQVLVRALFQFFRKLRSQMDVNGADATAIGRVFAPLLLRDPRSGGAPVTSGVELVAFLIESFEMVFSDESEAMSSDLINATLRAIGDLDRMPAYAAVPYIGSSGAPVDTTVSRRTERMSLMWVNADEDQLSQQVAGEGGF
jgi:Ran GTPase-activating protein (RanGAP) involved in mRNA processing and transport